MLVTPETETDTIAGARARFGTRAPGDVVSEWVARNSKTQRIMRG